MNTSNRLTPELVLIFLFCSFFVTTVNASEWIYTIKKGDNLWRISENFLVDVHYWRQLQRLNGVKQPNFMPPGSKLRIPLNWTRIRPANATVKKTAGSVEVTSVASGAKKKATQGMILNTGDLIKTGSGSSATLVFEDGSRLILREESDLKLEKLESYGNKDVYNTQLELKRGRTDNEVNPFKKPDSRFEIRTPSATAAVRGTVYRVSAPDQNVTTTEVLKGEVGVANNYGKTNVPGGYGSLARADAPPTPPVVLLPAPDLSDVPDLIEQLPLRFNLPEIKNASSYRIQVTLDPTFQSLDFDGISKTPSARIAELPDGKYLMKVRGIDDKGLEGYDSTHKFTLNAKPEAPFPVAPQPEGAVPLGYNEFSWSQSGDITTYHFQLADNERFNQPVVDIKHHRGTTISIPESLAPGHWYWRVAAIDPEEGSGPFGTTSRFRVMKPGPDVEPALNETEIVLHWPAGADGDQYQIQVARDENFETLIADEKITEPQYTMPRPEEPGKIYMRVKLIDPDGFEGSWSTPQSLEIPVEPPLWKTGSVPFLIIS